MKNTKVTLVPLTANDREQFILDNQWAFKYGAMMEFGERDDHIDDDGEIISRATIEKSIDNSKSETYRIMLDGEKVGGLILTVTVKMVVTLTKLHHRPVLERPLIVKNELLTVIRCKRNKSYLRVFHKNTSKIKIEPRLLLYNNPSSLGHLIRHYGTTVHSLR